VYALCIGNSKYHSLSLRLVNPANDVAELRRAFAALPGCGERRVAVAEDVTSESWTNAVTGIRDLIAADIETNGHGTSTLVVVHYSGHGVDDGHTQFVVLADFVESDITSSTSTSTSTCESASASASTPTHSSSTSTLLPVATLLEPLEPLLARLPGAKLLLTLDMCRRPASTLTLGLRRRLRRRT
jgi:hypothetical protein